MRLTTLRLGRIADATKTTERTAPAIGYPLRRPGTVLADPRAVIGTKVDGKAKPGSEQGPFVVTTKMVRRPTPDHSLSVSALNQTFLFLDWTSCCTVTTKRSCEPDAVGALIES